jgi:hypothetical protein
VAEDQPPGVDAVEQFGLVVGGLGIERADVRGGGGVADQPLALPHARRERGEVLDEDFP